MNNCRNCKESIDVNWDYCPTCGRPTKLRRIDKHYFIQELADFFSANKGMVYTVKNVLLRPAESVKQFLTEERYRFVKPVTFLFISSLIYGIVIQIFNITITDYYQQADPTPALELVSNWIFEYPGYLNIVVGLLWALFLKMFFRKVDYNLFEILVLLCFVLGITTLFSSVMAIIERVADNVNIMFLSFGIGMIYPIWAIGQFLDRKKVSSYVKAFLSYLVTTLFLGFLMIVVVIIETVIKHL